MPVILYGQFRNADLEKRALLLQSVRQQGRVISQGLLPLLASTDRNTLPILGRELARFADDITNVKLLFEPADGSGFFYIASWPAVSNAQMEIEREKLREQGVLGRLAGTCDGELTSAFRYQTPSGNDEIVTSMTPLKTGAGCWAVITSFSATALPGASLGQPYWSAPEVRVAAVIYFAMAVLTFTTLWSIRRGLTRFAERARSIRRRAHRGGSFSAQNDVPELSDVAEEFDRMVDVLQNSARDIRRAAEDNAHAFKTPIAVIRQSLEPLKRAIPNDNHRGHRALGLIESSLDKLDGLVASARKLDETTADLIETPRNDVDLSDLLERLLQAHSDSLARRRLLLKGHIAQNIIVRANEEMVETVIENLLDNAISFSPEGESIGIRLVEREGNAELLIGDAGPGVPPENLPRIFDRYFSHRPEQHGSGEAASIHFGIGLWIARRNVESLGGTITAENRHPNGLLMRVTLPLAKHLKEPRSPAPAPKLAVRPA